MSNNVWFTSDPHFGHANVIKYCDRPFATSDEMDEAIIENWNTVVQPGDRVYLLGDVGFMKPGPLNALLYRLKGQKFLIRGNHDREATLKEISHHFVWVKEYFELKHEKQKIVLSHYPFLTWNGCHRGSWHLHGHCHGTLPAAVNEYARRLDVGVDCHGFMPISFAQVKRILEKREYRPVDHHTER